MIADFLIPFFAIALAEFADKSQLILLCLVLKTKDYLKLFAGAMLAFAVADGIFIAFGNYVADFISPNVIKITVGVVFIIFGIYMLSQKEEQGKQCKDLKSPFYSTFTLILLAELGDKTQIFAGLFAMKYNPWFVFIGIMLALAILSLMAIYLGKFVSKRIKKKHVSIISGIIFIIIGVVALI